MAERRAAGLYEVRLLERCGGGDALVAEPTEVERPKGAGDDEFAERPSGGRRLLHAMPTEAIDKIHIFKTGVAPDDGVLVKGVVVVETGPGALHLEGGEGRHAIGEGRPDDLIEHRIIDVEILAVGILILRRRNAAQEVVALRPEEDAARVDDEIGAGHLAAAIDDVDEALAGAHRKVEPGERRHRAGLRSGRADDDAASDLAALGEGHRRGTTLLARDRGDGVLYIACPERHRLAAKCLQQTIGVEPAFV